jgi:hypothetical protein
MVIDGTFVLRLLFLKVAEFAAIVSIFSVLEILLPESVSSHSSSVLGLIIGSIVAATFVYLFTLYPLFSTLLLILLRKLGVKNPITLSFCAGIISIVYALASIKFYAHPNHQHLLETSQWIALSIFAVFTTVCAYFLFRKLPQSIPF